jgi:predicted AlkP superfamily phosphohydrolase/phosphomutase
MSCPVEEMEHGFVQGGLGIPDITGSIGAWYILSSSTADVPVGEKKKTNSGGWVLRLREENGVFSCEIPGPDDLARKEEVSDRLAAIESKLKDFDVAPETKSKLREERDRLKAEQKKGFAVTVPIEIRRRDGDEALEISLDGTTQTVKDGSWSGWFRLTFPLPAPLELPAVVRLRVLRTKDWIRVFVPPLGYDPEDPPPYAAMSSPIEYSGELARAVGNYETVGWACWQNPLKDLEFGEDAFLENIRMLTEWRKKMVLHELCRDDWDLFLGVFGETDRVQHMMWRLIDPSSPTYDEALAAKYGSAILDVYKAMDEIVGDVMRSHVDDRTTLVVLSDHGFQPFNRQVNLNTWLVEQGYLVPTSGGGDPKNVVATVPEERHDYLLFMDQERSRAFALGLGKIYLNLAGREPKGIVTKEEYPGLCEEIRRKLLALRDPKDGRRVVDRVFLRDEIYQGPYARSDADLFLGFAKGYRIGWKTTSGGIAAETIEDNPQKWSGDHVSVDPLHVPGILVSNRRFDPASNPDMTDIAPTVLALLGLPAEGMDGSPIAER